MPRPVIEQHGQQKRCTWSILPPPLGLCTRTIGLAEANKLKVSPPSLRLLSDVLDVSDAYLGAFGNLPELTLGERIKKARLFHWYTKREFAKPLGVSERTLFDWAHNRKIPPAKSFNDVSKFLQYPVQFNFTFGTALNLFPFPQASVNTDRTCQS